MAIMPNACAMRRRVQGLSVDFAAMTQHRVINAPSNMLHALRPKVAELSTPRSLVIVTLRP
jgi:hypothetical protein